MGCEEEEVFEEAGGADVLYDAVEDLAAAAQLLHALGHHQDSQVSFMP